MGTGWPQDKLRCSARCRQSQGEKPHRTAPYQRHPCGNNPCPGLTTASFCSLCEACSPGEAQNGATKQEQCETFFLSRAQCQGDETDVAKKTPLERAPSCHLQRRHSPGSMPGLLSCAPCHPVLALLVTIKMSAETKVPNAG